MKFVALELRGIRHFTQKRIEFKDGLNIVHGPNESGKSTILASLLASLLKPTEKERSSLTQWGTARAEIKLTYTAGGHTYCITRVLHPEVRDVLEGETRVEDPATVQALIEAHLGFTDRALFESSTVVKQNEMQILQEEGARTKIRDRMRTLISGVPQRSTEDALLSLERSIAEATSFLGHAEGRIRSVEGELSEFRGIDEGLTDLQNRLTVYESDLQRDKALYGGYTALLQYRGAEADYRALTSMLEEVENLETYVRKIPVREKELIKELQRELERISTQQDRLIEEKRTKKQELAEQKGKLSTMDDELEGVGVEKESFFDRLSSLFRGSSRARREELASRRVEVSRNVARLEDILEQIEEQLVDLRGKFQIKGEQLRTLMEQCGEYENWTVEMLEKRRDEYEARIGEILKGKTREELEMEISRRREDADKKRMELVKKYPDLKDKKDTERISVEQEKLAEIIEEWGEKIKGLKSQMDVLSSRAQERETLREELRLLTRGVEERSLQKRADEVAHNVIGVVYEELKERFAPELEKRAEAILRRITGGRYDDILVKKEDLEVEVRVPERRELVDVEVLSQGTRDQLYLSLRIALSELLSGDKNPPLLFDEAFSTFDDDRLRETLTILKEMAETTQVIVFTHDESYARYGYAIPLKEKKGVY